MIELFGSRVSTCVISILLIVYGSFRSLNMEQEAREKEKKRQSESSNNLLTGEPSIPIDPSEFFIKLHFSIVFSIKTFSFAIFQTQDSRHSTLHMQSVYLLELQSHFWLCFSFSTLCKCFSLHVQQVSLYLNFNNFHFLK